MNIKGVLGGKILKVGLILLIVIALTSIGGSATSTFVSSKNVLEIDENTGGVGGPIDSSLFTTGGAFDAGVVNWTHVNLGQFSDVGNNDSAILFQVNISDMTTAQKTTLVNFVTGGGKLIIWDADAGAQSGFPNNYDWLPTNLVFSTSVPGQLGVSGGVLQITEENDLSSSNPVSPKFINTNLILNSTDAIGDGNIVKTNGTDWCQDMFGQNAANPPQSGPAHMYSRPGGSANNGFIVYSALDWDSGSVGGSGGNELRKILRFELEVGNTSNLPCSVEVVSVPQNNDNGSISGMKFNDLNDNGIHDSGESGIQNWQIKLTDQNGNVVTNLTDNSGNYKFFGLADGNYAIDEVLQSGWNQTFPATGNYAVEIINGIQVTGKDFGNFQANNITENNITENNIINCDTENHVKVNIKGKDNNVKVAVTGSDNHVKVNIKGKHNRINVSVSPCGDPVNNTDPPLGSGVINSDHLVNTGIGTGIITGVNDGSTTNVNSNKNDTNIPSIVNTGTSGTSISRSISPFAILREQRIAASNGEYY